MSFPTLDDWLFVLGNKTRREIMRLLTQEAHYPFQIAKQLSISQQTAKRHLEILVERNIATKKKKVGTKGPDRHYYTLKGSIFLSASIAPKTFDITIAPFPKELPEKTQGVSFLLEILSEVHNNSDFTETITRLLEVLQSLDVRAHTFSKKRLELLLLKQLVLHEISDQISETGLEYSHRSMFWSALEHKKLNIEDLNEGVSLEVSIIREEVLEILSKQVKSTESDSDLRQTDVEGEFPNLEQSLKLKSLKQKRPKSQQLLPPASDNGKQT